jgi:hypothetical protein
MRYICVNVLNQRLCTAGLVENSEKCQGTSTIPQLLAQTHVNVQGIEEFSIIVLHFGRNVELVLNTQWCKL